MNRDKFISSLLDNLLSDVDMLEFLQKNSTIIPSLNYEEYTHLMDYNCWDSLSFLIEKNHISITYSDVDNQSLMLISAFRYNFLNEKPYLNFIKTLSEKGIDINEKNFLSQNLFLALISNKYSVRLTVDFINKLENLGLVIEDENHQHFSLGSAISQSANMEIFSHLYPRCDITFEDLDGNNMLLNACSNSDIRVLKFLVKEGLKDKINTEGKNACNIALDYREINNYQYLITNNLSHPNQVVQNELTSFIQSFNVFYMLKNVGEEKKANQWLEYYLSTIDIKLLTKEKIDKLKDTYINFNNMEDFFQNTFIIHEKKTLENDSIQMSSNLKVKLKI